MIRSRTRRHVRALAAPLVAGLVALLVLPAGRGRADDRDLLRTGTAKPYLFILLDTSASMNLKLGTDGWTPGGADSPGSRLYQAKQALYDVLEDADDVQFGFASFNQDNVYASAKHWIYYTTAALPATDWDLNFPRPEPLLDPYTCPDGSPSADGRLTRCPDVRSDDPDADDPDAPDCICDDDDGDGNPDTDIWVDDVDGDVLTFGPRFTTGITNAGLAGTCASPLNLSVALDRQKVQSFAIDPTLTSVDTNTGSGNPGTVTANAAFWVKPSNGGSTYRLGVVGAGALGGPLTVTFTLQRLTSSCNTNPRTFADPAQTLVRTFGLDLNLNQTFLVDTTASTGNPNTREGYAALWDVSDTHSSADFGADHPFTGKGWEGNYDSGIGHPDDITDGLVTNVDRHCETSGPGTTCVQVKPALQTTIASEKALDIGDVLPFHWSIDNKDAFLRRLAPNHSPSGVTIPEFRNAPYFQNSGTNMLALNNGAVRPLLALDKSPLAKSINDFRCWYLGKEGHGATGKCAQSAFFDLGWESVACAADSEFGCRRPYLIVISDGEDNTPGEDATADVSAMFQHSSVKTWALNLGNPASCGSGGGLHPIVQVGGCAADEECCITVSTRAELVQELRRIIGLIRTEVRSFASAAVPSVQASVEQKVFFTNFVPFNDSSVWDGHVQGFIKPVPLDEITGRPLFDQNCDGSGNPPPTDNLCYCDPSGEPACTDSSKLVCECHLWDAGQLLKDTQYDASDPLDLADAAKRRVFYSIARGTEAGEWPQNRRLFDPTNTLATEVGVDDNLRYDLWSGLAIKYQPDDAPDPDAVDTAAQIEANRVIAHTLSVKTGTVQTGETTQTISFLMGDVFHSTPQVVGTPTNTLYFAQDLYGNGQPCLDGDNTHDVVTGSDTGNPGYRCFFRRAANRRKLLLVGSDDGMVHAFDAGIFHRGGPGVVDTFTSKILNPELELNGEFDNGSGHELFAYIPRAVMPTLTQLASSVRHRYTVDGTLRAADVFIDPVNDTGTFPEERQWRTVGIGGLREGGRGYYALDVTQPDPVTCKAGTSATDCTDETRGQGFYVSADFTISPTRDPALPRCLGDAANVPPANCGPIPYPSALWDFDDSILDTASGIRYQLDEDDNGIPDLGPTWSLPNLGRIRVCQPGGSLCNPDISSDASADDHLVDRYVAIFGGGMDVDSKATPEAANRGDWLYMVDVETGQVIYKRQLVGAAPSEPAAVDTDQDGYIDRVYLGTLAGKLYRVDLGRDVDGNLPVLTSTTVNGLDPETGTANSSLPTLRIPASVTGEDEDDVRPIWVPGVLFDTRRAIAEGTDPTTVPYRPIYQRPSVIFVAKLGLYALAFGTGDREDLWSTLADSGRFYIFVDDVARIENLVTPKTEAGLRAIDPDTTANNLTEDFLLDPSFRGWVLDLHDNERVITDSFALAGVTIFSSFIPKIVDDEGEVINVGCSGGGTGGGGGGPDPPVATCSRLGDSQIFVVNTTNANGFLIDSGGAKTRYRTVANFVTNPFAEPGQSKRAAGSSEGTPGHTADDLTPNLQEVMETLKGLFPANCKFANYRIDIKTIAADTSLEFIAPVPVCIIERNWKEF